MENTVTIKLEDYNLMRDNLTEKSKKIRQIEKSIEEYYENEEGIHKQSLFSRSKTTRITIDKKKILNALGYDKETIIEIK